MLEATVDGRNHVDNPCLPLHPLMSKYLNYIKGSSMIISHTHSFSNPSKLVRLVMALYNLRAALQTGLGRYLSADEDKDLPLCNGTGVRRSNFIL